MKHASAAARGVCALVICALVMCAPALARQAPIEEWIARYNSLAQKLDALIIGEGYTDYVDEDGARAGFNYSVLGEAQLAVMFNSNGGVRDALMYTLSDGVNVEGVLRAMTGATDTTLDSAGIDGVMAAIELEYVLANPGESREATRGDFKYAIINRLVAGNRFVSFAITANSAVSGIWEGLWDEPYEGDGTPGDGIPGDDKPGDGTPGDGTPGDDKPGDGMPGVRPKDDKDDEPVIHRI